MDITSVSGASAFAQQKVQSNIQSSVDAKVLNIAKSLGAGALQLLQSASQGSTASLQTTAGDTDSDGGGVDVYG